MLTDNNNPWKAATIVMYLLFMVCLGTLINLFNTAPNLSFEGLTGHIAGGLGTILVVLVGGCIGLLYKKNRLAGYLIASWLVFFFMVYGMSTR